MLAAAGGGGLLHLRPTRPDAPVADRAFLGQHCRRRLCRALPRTDRTAGALRADRPTGCTRRATAPYRLAPRFAAGPVGAVRCRRPGWSRVGIVTTPFRRMGRALSRRRPGEPTPHSGCSEGTERRVPGHL